MLMTNAALAIMRQICLEESEAPLAHCNCATECSSSRQDIRAIISAGGHCLPALVESIIHLQQIYCLLLSYNYNGTLATNTSHCHRRLIFTTLFPLTLSLVNFLCSGILLAPAISVLVPVVAGKWRQILAVFSKQSKRSISRRISYHTHSSCECAPKWHLSSLMSLSFSLDSTSRVTKQTAIDTKLSLLTQSDAAA